MEGSITLNFMFLHICQQIEKYVNFILYLNWRILMGVNVSIE